VQDSVVDLPGLIVLDGLLPPNGDPDISKTHEFPSMTAFDVPELMMLSVHLDFDFPEAVHEVGVTERSSPVVDMVEVLVVDVMVETAVVAVVVVDSLPRTEYPERA
jgi:hypothetical protein